jgi:putative ABC transport system permease protein
MKTILSSLQLALLNIRANFFRTILSILGIVIGVASLVGILSLIDGMELFARDQIARTTSLNAINIHPELYSTVNNVRIRKDTFATFSYDDLKSIKSSISQPVDVYARSTSNGIIKIDSAKDPIGVSAIASLASIEPEAALISGEFFSDKNQTREEIPALVSEGFVKTSGWKIETAIGKMFSFDERAFQVIGILKSAKQSDGTPRFFYPISSLSVSRWRRDPPEIYILAKNTEEVQVISKSIKEWIANKFPKNKNDFAVLTNELRVEQAAKGFLLFRVIMGLIVGISVLVGGIGVMNVLLISVTERTREIGIRKAVGANRRHIVLQFLSESITISAVGSFIGFVLGVTGTMAVVPIVKAITKIPFQAAYTWNTFFVIAAVAVVVGIAFGTYPAIRASRLDPVEAIRHE